jgi:hypothetical protein
MSWTFIASTSGYNITGTTVDTDDTLHLEVGDVVIANLSWAAGASTIGIATTLGDDAFTLQSTVNYSTRNFMALGHVVIGVHNETATLRGTLATAQNNLILTVMQFRPDAGETVSVVAGPSPASNGSGSAPITGNISPTGDDLLVFAGVQNAAGVTSSNEQIADAVAAGYVRRSRGSIFYSLFTASQTNIHAQSTFGDDDSWVTDILALASTAPAPTSSFGEVLVGGAWVSADECNVVIGNSWKAVTEIQVVVGGAWKSLTV